MITPYSQRDTEWAQDRLGANPPTMGEVGCLVTAIASAVADMTSHAMSPGYLNYWLRENKGFASGNLFIFNSVAPLGLKLTALIKAENNEIALDKLTQALDDGAAVVLQVDSTPGGVLNQHWVRAISLTDKDGDIMDPWQFPGKEMTKLSRYFASGWTPKRAIFFAAIYTPATDRALAGPSSVADSLPAELAAAAQPFICRRPPDE
ncbi:MAG: hypothetical protein BWY52_02780 [Chloroflexi bacterium ADurb.Bin325]|nr:MAG: hypothetical protein BWY52_02780 [Chloroflexi bacterium ADurb.Bin325]